MKYPYIAFDVDGTLIDALPVAVQTMRQALFEHTGHLYPPERLALTMGLTNEDAFSFLGLEYSDACVRRWTELQLAANDQITLFDGVVEILEALKCADCVLGIVTSRNRAEYEADRRLFDQIEGFFDHIVLSEMTKRHKPSPEPLLKFMELCGAPAEQTLYIGDAACDMQCAASAGVKGALALWGAVDQNAASDYCLASPQAILRVAETGTQEAAAPAPPSDG